MGVRLSFAWSVTEEMIVQSPHQIKDQEASQFGKLMLLNLALKNAWDSMVCYLRVIHMNSV